MSETISQHELLNEALRKLKTVYSLFEIMKITDMNKLNESIYMEANMPVFNPAIAQAVNMQQQATVYNIKDITRNYNNKLNDVENLFERILNDKAKIREIKTRIDNGTSNEIKTFSGDIAMAYNMCDSLISDLDSAEVQLNSIFTNLKNLGTTITNINTPGAIDPSTVDPNMIMNIKNNLSYFGNQIAGIKNKVRDIEQDIIALQNNINSFVVPNK